MDNVNPSQHNSLEVKTPSGLKVIYTMDIMYVKAARKCSILYLADLNSVISYHPVKWYGKYLLTPLFFRCHNTFIVNCRFVDSYCKKNIILMNKVKIPLSRLRYRSFRENLKYLKGEQT